MLFASPLAAFSTAFCTILPCTTNPFLHQNKPPRESIFCGKVGVWWAKRPLFMLKFLLKTRQNDWTEYAPLGNDTENTCAYNRQREWLKGMQSTANWDCTMETQK